MLYPVLQAMAHGIFQFSARNRKVISVGVQSLEQAGEAIVHP